MTAIIAVVGKSVLFIGSLQQNNHRNYDAGKDFAGECVVIVYMEHMNTHMYYTSKSQTDFVKLILQN